MNYKEDFHEVLLLSANNLSKAITIHDKRTYAFANSLQESLLIPILIKRKWSFYNSNGELKVTGIRDDLEINVPINKIYAISNNWEDYRNPSYARYTLGIPNTELWNEELFNDLLTDMKAAHDIIYQPIYYYKGYETVKVLGSLMKSYFIKD